MSAKLVRTYSRVLVFFLCGSLLFAEQSTETAAPAPGLEIRSLNALQEFEGPAQQQYTIGDGDELDIQVVGRPEISGTQLVGPDGRITLPLFGSFEIRNMTREDAAQAIAKIFERYYTSVNVTVRVSKYGSNRIFVLGHVAHPGVLYFENEPTLLDALTKSPALSATGAPDASSLPRRCAIFRGKEQAVWIDLRAMMEQGGSVVNLRLKRDDVVYIPDERDDLVSVLGEVKNPGMMKLQPKTTLLELLAMSGGLTTTAGSPKIEILRPGSATAQEVAFKDLMNPHKTVEVSLQQGDVIYVQKGTAAKFSYVLQQIAPLSTMLLIARP
jgi:polysaccharide export outer membrane protein